MSVYTTMPISNLLNQLEKDLQAAGARLLAQAMRMHSTDDPGRIGLVRASEAVLIAARKVGKHMAIAKLDNLLD